MLKNLKINPTTSGCVVIQITIKKLWCQITLSSKNDGDVGGSISEDLVPEDSENLVLLRRHDLVSMVQDQ